VAAVTVERFGTLASGEPVERLTLAAGDLTVRLLTLGAIVQDVRLAGIGESLTLGSERLEDYAGAMRFAGPVVGPVANRIAGAAVTIAGRRHALVANLGRDTLHGGPLGTHARPWLIEDLGPDRAVLALDLRDGDEGWPGNRRITAAFRIEPPARLVLTLSTTTDAPTFANLTNHSYWRLPGSAAPVLRCPAGRFVALDGAKLATGATPPVAGTAFDFRAGRAVGAGAYDICLILSDARRALTPAAQLSGGGLAIGLETTEAGLQIHDGFRPGSVALEAQNWPGAAMHPHFPQDLLLPGEVRVQTTAWSFTRTGAG
jgi:aldose 1-epimerase